MAWTEEDLIILEKSIVSGATRVKYADKEVEYRSLTEMQTIRQTIRDELGLNGPSPETGRRRYGSFSKGLK